MPHPAWPGARSALGAGAVLSVSFLAGAVPFAQLGARLLRGADLREHGNGTVSGTGLYEITGLGPLIAAGLLDVAKGAVGPLLVRRYGGDRPVLTALAAGAGVAGHDWSPFLRGAGGRGLAPALGALAVTAPPGAAVLLGGMAAGRMVRQTALFTLAADAALVPVLRRSGGAHVGVAVLVPMVTKRVFGNGPAPAPSAYAWRLLFDRDTPDRERP